MKYIVCAFLFLMVTFRCDADITIKPAPYDKNKSPELSTKIKRITDKYCVDNSKISKDYPYGDNRKYQSCGQFDWEWKDTVAYPKNDNPNLPYLVKFNGKELLAIVTSFNPLLMAEPSCPANHSDNESFCEGIARTQSTCHVFFLNPDNLKIEAVAPLNIARDPRQMPGQKERTFFDFYYKRYNPKSTKPIDPRYLEGWPLCSSLSAVAIAKDASDGLLFVLNYIDSAAPVDPRNEPPVFTSTVLMLLREEWGKLKLYQESSCLGNPNTISTIAEARKVIRACNAADKKVDPGDASWTDIISVPEK
ncbi:hypothetical protein [Methylovorus sp. MP688]|uniref:hypothetical protein n=1 Tax=Methylovorus sp. (strain MP688) TaxID=887061 RepID=UPI0001EC4D71|nr:hypothetical protein [Methylovorus sp. MP688]ADQ85202.1 conserved hypothetical protein [Methylovorus sp. MP688]